MSPSQKPVQRVSEYTVLPLTIPPLPAYPKTTTHYIYSRPHDPKLPDPNSSRSLFLANVPIDSTELHFRSLFADQLGGGRVERVQFEATRTSRKRAPQPSTVKSKKRKRADIDAEDLELELPETWDRVIHASGSTAVVVFVDKASMELSQRAIKKAVKSGRKIVWGKGLEDKLPKLGSQRYLAHHNLTYPSSTDLSAQIDSYMTSFAEAETARSRTLARQRQVPDADGFITVTRGSRAGPARNEEAQERLERQKKKAEEKKKGMVDFYRFQVREKRKEQAGELKRKFEEDKKKVEEMRKENKGRFTPM